MDEFVKIVLEVCISAILIEIIIQLFPNKFKSIIQGTAYLVISVILVSGIININIELDASEWYQTPEINKQDIQQSSVDYGLDLLKERIYVMLNSAGISVSGEKDGIFIKYRMSDESEIEIAGIEVCLQHESDRDRAYTLLQAILTPIIPVEVYTE